MAKYIMGQPCIHDPWWELRRRQASGNPGTCSLKTFENCPRKNGREPLSGRSLAATIYSRLSFTTARWPAESIPATIRAGPHVDLGWKGSFRPSLVQLGHRRPYLSRRCVLLSRASAMLPGGESSNTPDSKNAFANIS